MIKSYGLTKKYKRVTAIQDVCLEIGKGDIYGFIGPNGAGKTTTLKILATLLLPSSGTAFIGGRSVIENPYGVRRLIGYMPDFFGVYTDMEVEEYLRFFAAAYDIRGEEQSRVVSDIMALTDLVDRRGDLIGGLSRGMQQRLGLARVLVHDPEVLLLDEPASGLDPRARVEIREILKELCSLGKTILISSHILSEVAELCTRIGILNRGKLQVQGPIDELLSPDRKIRLRVDGDGEQAGAILAASPLIHEVEAEGSDLILTLRDRSTEPAEIADLVFRSKLRLNHFALERPTLEQAFLDLTGSGDEEAEA